MSTAVMRLNGRDKKRFREFAAPIRKKYTAARSALKSRAPNIQKAALITAGGGAAGVVNAYMPEVMGIQTPLIVGSAFVATSLYLGNDVNPDNDGLAYGLLCLGSGMLAVAANDFVEQSLRNGAVTNTLTSNGNGQNGLTVAGVS